MSKKEPGKFKKTGGKKKKRKPSGARKGGARPVKKVSRKARNQAIRVGGGKVKLKRSWTKGKHRTETFKKNEVSHKKTKHRQKKRRETH